MVINNPAFIGGIDIKLVKGDGLFLIVIGVTVLNLFEAQFY